MCTWPRHSGGNLFCLEAILHQGVTVAAAAIGTVACGVVAHVHQVFLGVEARGSTGNSRSVAVLLIAVWHRHGITIADARESVVAASRFCSDYLLRHLLGDYSSVGETPRGWRIITLTRCTTRRNLALIWGRRFDIEL